MLLAFDKSKYPLDHEWIEYNDSIDNGYIDNFNYHDSVLINVFNVSYSVKCNICGLNVIHRELNENYEDYELTLLYNDDITYIVLIRGEDIGYYNHIHYNAVLSCAEMQIKKLLE